jgi:hypothetical protein
MSELEILLKTLASAKEASLASYQALQAVEQMLSMKLPDAETPSVSETELEAETDDGSCKHPNAIPVSIMTGDYLVCECGHQEAV